MNTEMEHASESTTMSIENNEHARSRNVKLQTRPIMQFNFVLQHIVYILIK